MMSTVSRLRCRDHDASERGFILLEWALAAALGLTFAVAVVAALIGFRRQATAIAETARLQADAAVTVRLLRHYIERAVDPTMPGLAMGPRMRCEADGRVIAEWPIAARLTRQVGKSSQWHCDLQSWRGALILDYPVDGDASWRDAANRPADCQGASLLPSDAPKGPRRDVPMMRAALTIKVTDGDTTPGLFCLGRPDVVYSKPKGGSSALVDGVERLVVWRGASFHEICIVMRGRIRRAPTQPTSSDKGRAGAQDSVTKPGAAIDVKPVRGDRCEGALQTVGKSLGSSNYVGPDGYRRHVVRAVWPAAER